MLGVAEGNVQAWRAASNRRVFARSLASLLLIGAAAGLIGIENTVADSTTHRSARSMKENASAVNNAVPHGVEDSNDPSDMQCGLHSLFVLCRLLGHDIPYATIESNTPVGLKGSSLLELQDAARALGVDLSIYKCDPTCVEAVRHTPCIALIRASHQKEADGERTMLVGHYVVTEPARGAAGAGHVHIFDSSFNLHESLSNEDFASVWTGYYLRQTPWYSSTMPKRAAVAGAVGLIGLSMWRFRRFQIEHTIGYALPRAEAK
jgi:hypothetical protein